MICIMTFASEVLLEGDDEAALVLDSVIAVEPALLELPLEFWKAIASWKLTLPSLLVSAASKLSRTFDIMLLRLSDVPI